jgi:hypothetical protein
MHTPAHIQLSNKGRTAVLTIGSQKMQARILSPAGAAFSVLPAQPLPASPHPEGIDKNEGISRLTIHLKKVKSERIIVEIKPLTGAGSTDTIHMPANLEEW